MTYKTKQGDTWDIIAFNCYSNEMKADVIMAANLNLLDYFIFPSGVILQIPELVTDDNTLLPDWRR